MSSKNNYKNKKQGILLLFQIFFFCLEKNYFPDMLRIYNKITLKKETPTCLNNVNSILRAMIFNASHMDSSHLSLMSWVPLLFNQFCAFYC